jgi:hypothetical protein
MLLQATWQTIRRMFNNMHCLVMPVFKPVAVEDRRDLIQDIRSVLEECFLKHNLKYAETDVGWLHVGIYSDNGKKHVILSNLANLENIGNNSEVMVSDHIKILEDRLDTEMKTVASALSGEEVTKSNVMDSA